MKCIFVPLQIKQPRPGLWGAILDRLLGTQSIPNPSSFAGRFVVLDGERCLVSSDAITWHSQGDVAAQANLQDNHQTH
jgi:hypothetical protein